MRLGHAAEFLEQAIQHGHVGRITLAEIRARGEHDETAHRHLGHQPPDGGHPVIERRQRIGKRGAVAAVEHRPLLHALAAEYVAHDVAQVHHEDALPREQDVLQVDVSAFHMRDQHA